MGINWSKIQINYNLFIHFSQGVAASAAFTTQRAEGANGALEGTFQFTLLYIFILFIVIAASKGGFVVLVLSTIGIFSYAAWRFFEGLYGLRVDMKVQPFLRYVNGYVVPFASCMIYIIYGAGYLYIYFF